MADSNVRVGPCSGANRTYSLYSSSFGLWAARHENRCKHILYGIAIAVISVQWTRIILGPQGDFPRHWEFGRRFVAGEFLYGGGLNIPYPPFWGMANAPVTLLPMRVAQPLLYPMAFVALMVLLFLLHRLTRNHLLLQTRHLFWATALALILSSRFIARDLIECGPNLALVGLTWVSIYFWVRRNELLAGTCLGLAIALKCTPALFAAYFAWKRQWKMVAITAAAAAIFTLAPVLRQGPSSYAQHMNVWFLNVSRGITEADPSRGILGEEKLQNFSLRPALARFLMRLPADHAGRAQHSWYVDFFEFSPAVAGALVKSALLLLLASVAWVFRQPIQTRGDLDNLWEVAAISLLTLLYSPITWSQHCVAVIPAFYLITRTAVRQAALDTRTMAALGAYLFLMLAQSRDLVGRNFSLLLDSYHVTTWALVLIFAVTLTQRRCVVRWHPHTGSIPWTQ